MSFLEKYQDIISTALEKERIIGTPDELYKPMDYMLSIGGKRFRPIILLMACDVFGGDLKQAIKPALGIEYFHNFTLIHDDIMDQATLRRNKKTVHIKYNPNIAILSGDALMIKSFQMLEDLKPDLFKSCFQLLSKTAVSLCEGQQYDMNFEKETEISYDDYIKMITGKTAVLAACALKMGALLAETSEEDAEYLYEYGKYLGIAFQLKDDYLDVFGEQIQVGKKVGGDIYENKKTILYLLAQGVANKEQKKELEKWFETTEETEKKVQEVTQIYKELQVDAECLNLVSRYTEKSVEYLKKLSIAEEKKTAFYELTNYLLNREN